MRSVELSMRLLRDFLSYLSRDISQDIRVKYFGIIMAINYPLYYILWMMFEHSPIESFLLRLVCFLLCLPLIVYRKWPVGLLRYQRVYWMACVTFCLPFFFTFMTLDNQLHALWLMNSMSAVFFTLILFNFYEAVVLLVLGFGFGCLAFVFFDGDTALKVSISELVSIAFTLVPAFVIGGLFSYSRQKIRDLEMRVAKVATSSIAHEIRTPLAAISLGAELIENTLKKEPIEQKQLSQIKKVSQRIQSSIQQTQVIIDIILQNANVSKVTSYQLGSLSAASHIEEIVAEYPMRYRDIKINLNLQEDIEITSHPTLLRQLLFNLLHNACHYIHFASKGEIFISLEQEHKYGVIVFKDTGPGIPKRQLPSIFNAFFSQRQGGTGIGLPVCKAIMKAHSGDIRCDSVEGEYTEFRLMFPLASS